MKNHAIQKEWSSLLKQEQRFFQRSSKTEPSKWQDSVSKYVPDTLKESLDFAFYKAFQLVFSQGKTVIEKTYRRDMREQDFLVNDYNASVRGNRKSLRVFSRQSRGNRHFHTAVSTVEGIGMGLLGLGLPDIPVFTGILLRGIYQTALNYGFSYDTETEQIFILKLIQTALSHSSELEQSDAELNQWITAAAQAEHIPNCTIGFQITKVDQIRQTANRLSEELLYLKFVQGLPVIGVVGGLSDAVYMKKISQYVDMKYRRRFLERKRAKL